MKDVDKLKPCPFCGCKNVIRYYSSFCVAIECGSCGAKTEGNSAIVLYKRNMPPKELWGIEFYEATALVMLEEDGSEVHYPEHGYVGVNINLALKAYGAWDRWNKREGENEIR